MKRLLLVLAVLGAFLVIPTTASGHGACSAVAYQPSRSGSLVYFRGRLDCTETHQLAAYLYVMEYRRQPGGSWNLINRVSSGNRAPTEDIATMGFADTYDCRKDYQTRSEGFLQNTAGGGGHYPTEGFSSILYHSC